MKALAGEVTLHPGAAEDPANTIKADVYQFCDRWERVETEFARKEAALIERTSRRGHNDAGGWSSRCLDVDECQIRPRNLPDYSDFIVGVSDDK